MAIANIEPQNKKVSDYFPIVYLGEVNETEKTVEAISNFQIF